MFSPSDFFVATPQISSEEHSWYLCILQNLQRLVFNLFSEVLVFLSSPESQFPSSSSGSAHLKGLHNLLQFHPGSPSLGSPHPALCLYREWQNIPHQGTSSALQVALVALFRRKIHQWQLPASPTEDFIHQLQLAHFQDDRLCGTTIL